MEFKDKVVVVTGANRGIGLAITERFLREGAIVIGMVRSKNRFSGKTLEAWGEKLIPVECDMCSSDSIARACKEVKNITKKIDILINNAGIILNGNFAMTPMQDIRNVFEVNVFGTMDITQRLLRFMLKEGGSIINISSMNDRMQEPGISIYAMTKAAISSWTRTLAKELGSYQIRVNAVCPGNVDTDMVAGVDAEAVRKITEKQVIQRLARPQEIAEAVLFLASEKSSFMTGSLLRVDGGYYA